MKSTWDYLILGGGPAALQCAYYLEKTGKDYLILEAGPSVGTSFKRHPRHRTLISINKVYTGYNDPDLNMRYDWNSLITDDHSMLFKDYTETFFPNADHLCTYLEDFANRFELKLRLNTKVEKVSRKDGLFELKSGDTCFKGRRLIVATGLQKEFDPKLPGLELAETYNTMSIDPEEYKNQKVLIIGKGNSAFETADALIGTTSVIHIASNEVLRLAWETRYVGDLRAVNNNFLDTYHLKSQNALLDVDITKIEKEGTGFRVTMHYLHSPGEVVSFYYDRVIGCCGFRFDDSAFDNSCKPELTLNNRFPKLTSEWESSNIPDLYFAGTLTQSRDHKKTTSAFIHGFRYNAIALCHILNKKYDGDAWPRTQVSIEPQALAKTILHRINTGSALWQQFGFIIDTVQIREDGSYYLADTPADYVKSHLQKDCDHYLTVSLEFGPQAENVFAIKRRTDLDYAKESPFLHPVIRHYRNGEMVDEVHILEDLFGQWKDEKQHVAVLENFLNEQLTSLSMV